MNHRFFGSTVPGAVQAVAIHPDGRHPVRAGGVALLRGEDARRRDTVARQDPRHDPGLQRSRLPAPRDGGAGWRAVATLALREVGGAPAGLPPGAL